MKLNLGCGKKHMEGYVNVDLDNNWSSLKPDLIADISKRLPFDDESVDEVASFHVIEHFYRYDIENILEDWIRVLKKGGTFVVECPCLNKILELYNHFLSKQIPVEPQMTIYGLYGNPGYRVPEMTHKWCYSVMELKSLLESYGLKVVTEKPTTHFPVRDMRLVGIK